jgi:hypothetical protein
MCDVNLVRKWAGSVLSDCINKYISSFLCGFYGFSSKTSLSHCVYRVTKPNFPSSNFEHNQLFIINSHFHEQLAGWEIMSSSTDDNHSWNLEIIQLFMKFPTFYRSPNWSTVPCTQPTYFKFTNMILVRKLSSNFFNIQINIIHYKHNYLYHIMLTVDIWCQWHGQHRCDIRV